jgi:hypothetical protein
MALLNDSTQFRDRELKRNPYGKNSDYNASHPNALSTGDDKGKGERNGSIGSATDILSRSRAIKFNKYSVNSAYESVDEKPIS